MDYISFIYFIPSFVHIYSQPDTHAAWSAQVKNESILFQRSIKIVQSHDIYEWVSIFID